MGPRSLRTRIFQGEPLPGSSVTTMWRHTCAGVRKQRHRHALQSTHHRVCAAKKRATAGTLLTSTRPLANSGDPGGASYHAAPPLPAAAAWSAAAALPASSCALASPCQVAVASWASQRLLQHLRSMHSTAQQGPLRRTYLPRLRCHNYTVHCRHEEGALGPAMRAVAWAPAADLTQSRAQRRHSRWRPASWRP